jgi:hypothetical protein
MRCERPGCGWAAVAPSDVVAREQYAEHLVEAHASTVDAEVPEGMVQVQVDGQWATVTPAEARRLHDERYGDDSPGVGE